MTETEKLEDEEKYIWLTKSEYDSLIDSLTTKD